MVSSAMSVHGLRTDPSRPVLRLLTCVDWWRYSGCKLYRRLNIGSQVYFGQ